MRCPAGEYATKVWTLLEISCQATEQSFLVANHIYWTVIGDLYDFEVQLDKPCKPGVWRLAVLANLFVLGRLIWICVPLCVVGVLLVAQPIGLFKGRGANSIGAAGLAVGILQVRAILWAWPCTFKSLLFAIPIWQTCIDKTFIILSLD